MRAHLKAAVGAVGIVLAAQAAAQMTLYEREGFRGRAFSTSDVVGNFADIGFNDRASSAVVNDGRWEVCQHANFQGQCVVLRPGQYGSLAQMGMDNMISSVRRIDQNLGYDNRVPSYAPPRYAYDAPQNYNAPPNYAYNVPPAYGYNQQSDERIYEVPVTSVRAVVGPPEQRCWCERQEVVENRGGPNVPGAILGAVIGGVLGHHSGAGAGRMSPRRAEPSRGRRSDRTWGAVAAKCMARTSSAARTSRATLDRTTGTSPTISGASSIGCK